jgi:predicted nucleic acid-binding protein
MNNSAICADASFVVQLLVDVENQTLRASWTQWQNEGRLLIAPTLFYYEVTNALYRYQRSQMLSESAVHNALELALNAPIQLHGDAALHARALHLATDYSLPATYDAHYLALAERMGAELWTLDRRLYRSVSHLSWVHTVEPE